MAKDKVQVLTCKILVWEPTDKSKFEGPPENKDKVKVITECVDIEIEDTYKKLINSATIKFPIGTVVRKGLVTDTGSEEVYTERMNDGALIEKRSWGASATPDDFHTGQRIRIYLGYYEEDYESLIDSKKRQEKIDEALTHRMDFDGYITKCSVSTPIEIRCENAASALKRKTLNHIPARNDVSVKKLFTSPEDGGIVDLLAGTGLKLHPDTEWDINIGRIEIPEGWTVADLLNNWNKHHLYCFVRIDSDNDIPYLVVGRSYFSGKVKGSIVDDKVSSTPVKINFDYDVAKDGLRCMNVDPLFLAVEAQSMTRDGKFYRITIALNDKYDSSDPNSEKFRLINECNIDKKTMHLMGISADRVKDKVDLSLYTVVPYISTVMDISKEDLVKEAKAYFTSYNKNGVDGNLTIFGDYHLKTGCKVELNDQRHPEKNGIYFVDEVSTKFGVNGFRQTIHMPYCIKKIGKEKEDGKQA